MTRSQATPASSQIIALEGMVQRLEQQVAAQQARIAELREALEDKADAASKALRRAWQLGQTYWQQADSEYTSQHRKADETQAKFQALVDETRAAILADETANGEVSGASRPAGEASSREAATSTVVLEGDNGGTK